MIHQHEKDLYRGNGKPGITTRLKTLEDSMERIEDLQAATDRKFWAVIVLLITILGSIITQMVRHG